MVKKCFNADVFLSLSKEGWTKEDREGQTVAFTIILSTLFSKLVLLWHNFT